MKEKSKWFGSLRDLTRKLKVLFWKRKKKDVFGSQYDYIKMVLHLKIFLIDYEDGPH